MPLRRLKGFLFFRNLLTSVLVGLLTGLLTGVIWPKKKGGSSDIVLGILGAILATFTLALLKGGVRLVPLLVLQLIGSLVLILLGRLLVSEK